MQFGFGRTSLNLACLLHETLWKIVVTDPGLANIDRTLEGGHIGRELLLVGQQKEQR